MQQMISKFQLTEFITCLDLPIGSKILKLMAQNDEPFLWVQIDADEMNKEKRTFVTFGTGHKIDNDHDYEYIDSFHQVEGYLTWHAYERFPKVTSDNVKEVRDTLGISLKEAKIMLTEFKGNIDNLFSSMGVTMSFEKFQASQEKDLPPPELEVGIQDELVLLYIDKQLFISIVPNKEVPTYSLTIGNQVLTSEDLEKLERELYVFAMSEGYDFL